MIFFHKGLINKKSALVKKKNWYQIGNKPLFEQVVA